MVEPDFSHLLRSITQGTPSAHEKTLRVVSVFTRWSNSSLGASPRLALQRRLRQKPHASAWRLISKAPTTLLRERFAAAAGLNKKRLDAGAPSRCFLRTD
jgi:hypothetical protein